MSGSPLPPQRDRTFVFPDYWGKLKFMLLDSYQELRAGHKRESHELFYRVLLAIKEHFAPERSDAEVMAAIDEYVRWKAVAGIAVFITRVDDKEWLEDESIYIPEFGDHTFDSAKKAWQDCFGYCPRRLIGGRVCFDQLDSESREHALYIKHFVGGIPIDLHHCNHPEKDHYMSCRLVGEACLTCQHHAEEVDQITMTEMDHGTWRSLMSVVDDNLARLQAQVERSIWEQVYPMGERALPYGPWGDMAEEGNGEGKDTPGAE